MNKPCVAVGRSILISKSCAEKRSSTLFLESEDKEAGVDSNLLTFGVWLRLILSSPLYQRERDRERQRQRERAREREIERERERERERDRERETERERQRERERETER